uniref:HMG box domain-containing protein n=1 Tax=Aegilops tauschii subsp. strangulata TaxID=200361 RepID=A0A453TBR9_AEGTS
PNQTWIPFASFLLPCSDSVFLLLFPRDARAAVALTLTLLLLFGWLLLVRGEFREEFKQKNPKNKSVAAVGKAAGERWKSLSESEKAPYVAKANKLKGEYNKAIAAYNKGESAAAAAPKKAAAKEVEEEDEEESDKSKSEINDDDDDEGSDEDEDDDE